MVEAAIKLLDNDNGYFLMVEGNSCTLDGSTVLTDCTLLLPVECQYRLLVSGARIDHAHHINEARMALEETVDFDKAVEYAYNNVNLQDTLIVVTADHGHPLTIASYAKRGNPILGECVICTDVVARLVVSAM